MSSSTNWEQLFNKPIFCPTCAAEITTTSCDCVYDLDYTEEVEDEN